MPARGSTNVISSAHLFFFALAREWVGAITSYTVSVCYHYRLPTLPCTQQQWSMGMMKMVYLYSHCTLLYETTQALYFACSLLVGSYIRFGESSS